MLLIWKMPALYEDLYIFLREFELIILPVVPHKKNQ